MKDKIVFLYHLWKWCNDKVKTCVYTQVFFDLATNIQIVYVETRGWTSGTR